MTDMTVANPPSRDEALADALYRLTGMQSDLVALDLRDAAGLVAMAIGLVLEAEAARAHEAPACPVSRAA